LKARLAAEGLFAAERKKRIPAMPLTVGFETSPTGAAAQDFVRIVRRRQWRGRVVILPAMVQGPGAAAEIIAMLQLAEQLGIFDLLVVGRGGGSIEDLWTFNQEAVVRAVAACTLPTISAVGHEIDFTLCDFAADLRAETPSAAAELITSHFVNCTDRVRQVEEALLTLLVGGVRQKAAELDHARSRLRLLSPTARVERGFLRLDDLANRLGAALRQTTQDRRQQMIELRNRLARYSPEERVRAESQRLLSLWKRLQAASPASVLHRGFVIMRDEKGKPVTRRAEVKPRPMSAEFADGTLKVRPEE
jgi:exodeoxyribonuclease VII large subunit